MFQKTQCTWSAIKLNEHGTDDDDSNNNDAQEMPTCFLSLTKKTLCSLFCITVSRIWPWEVI